MIKEIWKDKKDYEGHYQVSNFGRVKSIKFGKERIMNLVTDKYGYLYVNLYKNNIKKAYFVHRLVAEAFLPNPNNLPCVNHKDEDKSNNIVSNIEWCDVKYNTNYGASLEKRAFNSRRNKRIGKSNTNGKRSKPVLQYTLDGQFVKEWSSTMECDRNGYRQGNVAACCRGKLKKYKNFIWRYK